MSLSKKIFIISSSLLAIFLIFWGVYNLSFKTSIPGKSSSLENKNSAGSQPASPAKIASAKIEAVSEEAVLSPTFNKDDGSIKYYSPADGKFYQINLEGGNKKALSEKKFSDVVSVLWSPNSFKTILETKRDGEKRFILNDFSGDEEVLIKNNTDSITWISDARISYKYYDPKNSRRTLNVSDPDGTGWNMIADIAYRNIFLSPVPKTALISFWNEPDGFAETDFRSASALGTETKTLLKGFFGADYLWNVAGEKVLISHLNEKGGKIINLAIANANGGEYKNIGIPSFVSKCVWSRDGVTIYCALPGSIPETAALPNDYMAGKFKTADTFWKINTATGEKSRIIDLDKINGAFDASGLFLNADESSLFFVNKQDAKIYRINL